MATAGRRYVVVTRAARVPMRHHATLEAAADHVYRERAFARWEILAQEGLTASAKMRELTRDEKIRVERKLYPSLFD